uniref:Thioredoxin domain-containing protein n=1 Tax=Haptolina ericina TaxID=156174 RepID=A0A7S3AL87_9EUKA|mmetsp:Transcript_24574/g.55937  ORF Transcript_24574/g.55937 Transcript_24574/m.55937 type:complete len:162 (+) Transcript_24574:181-666(+)|eukprot:CAMPEP_0181193384 /NCGR_PEP_ID=MMETSP1096-20121128/13789_1 /TAXON_ID=156174 ORGANISM="Chrysochromulina ericina, Strain CCMP281" /NCGR_SAMPLE_ID=MMETSP1096 /ASSEMBLY_ACC=CAM_ASM_000453 /LENGTH=161 /DNA_ID=CAMNT_0023282845 /DNA_START=328 /DNA_END=813 /DNA_ORIENTATION=+
MKPDWDKLAEEFKDSSTVLIADVDCTADGKPLCEKHGVSGYPTIKSFPQGSDEGEDYKGGRDLDTLRKHAESLGPACSVDRKDLCSPSMLEALEKYEAMSQARRDAKLIKLKNAIKKAEDKHETLQKGLSSQYEASNQKLEALREKLKPDIKLMTAATPKE